MRWGLFILLLILIYGLGHLQLHSHTEADCPVIGGSGTNVLFPSEEACMECHGHDPAGIASRLPNGEDINVHDDWKVSMKYYSGTDPFWISQMHYEAQFHDSAKLQACISCHAPAAFQRAQIEEEPLSLNQLNHPLVSEGIQCASCHQMDFLDTINGHHTYASDGTIIGPYPTPFAGPMRDLFGWELKHEPLLRESIACKSCHSIVHEYDGEIVPEQTTYFEWEKSAYNNNSDNCQSCHTPYVFEPIKLSSKYPTLEGRIPFARHQFLGSNSWMLQSMRDQFSTEAAAVPDIIWEERMQAHRNFKRSALDLEILEVQSTDSGLYVQIEIRNLTGHKLPTGFPTRKLGIELIVEETDGDTLFHSGSPDSLWLSTRVQPHFDTINSETDFQIYEYVAIDQMNQKTSALLSARKLIKNNRLLPQGFSENHIKDDTIGVVGAALQDPNFTTAGTDKISYNINLPSENSYTIHCNIWYLNSNKDWIQSITQNGPNLAQSLKKYTDEHPALFLMQSNSIEFKPVNTVTPLSQSITFYPSPVQAGTEIYFSESISELQILDLKGQLLLHDFPKSNQFLIPASIHPGIYILRINDQQTNKIIIE